jgi:hypothetical protein
MRISIVISAMAVFDSAAEARLKSFSIVAIMNFYIALMAEISIASWISRRTHGRH